MLHRKIAAVAVVFLMIGITCASDLQNEQITRLEAIKSRAIAGTLTVGDMHEAGAHLRIAAARLRDAKMNSAIDSYLRNPANEAKVIQTCMASGHSTAADCHSALNMIRTSGSDVMLQAVASVSYNVTQWGRPIPITYQGGAVLLPTGFLSNCTGVNEAIKVVGIVSSAALLFPLAQEAAGVGLLFWSILDYAAYEWC